MGGTDTLSGAAATPAAQDPTNTAPPESATPMYIGSGNRVSNITKQMEGKGLDQELSNDHNSELMSAVSYSTNDDNSDDLELRKNTPARSNNSLELETIIEENVHMHDDVDTVLEEFFTSRALFTQSRDIEPTELVGTETTTTETPQDNGVMPPLLNQKSSPK